MVSKLDIVNHMLFTVGEQVQVTLETTHPSVIQALAVLTSADNDFQGRGWWFNTENSVILSANELGQIVVPTGTLSLTVLSTSVTTAAPAVPNRAQFAVRGTKLYDTVNHTFTIDGSVTANVVVKQLIEDLPHLAGMYLKHMAAEAMYTADDGDKLKMDRLQQKVSEAWHFLKAEELKVGNVNALNSPTAAALRYRITQAFSPSNPTLPGGR